MNAPVMSKVMDAQANGFVCASCGRKNIGKAPVRNNDNGPFFDTFRCAFAFRAAQGDAQAQINVDKIDAIFSKVKGN